MIQLRLLAFAFVLLQCWCSYFALAIQWRRHLTGEGANSVGSAVTYSDEDQAKIIQLMPKFELHAHLHGSIRLSTILDFIHHEIDHEKEKAKTTTGDETRYEKDTDKPPQQQTAVSNELKQWLEAEKKVLQLTLQHDDHGNSDKPFEIFPIIHRIIKRKDQVERILKEMIHDYMQENTKYLEIRTTPRGLSDGTTMIEYVELLVKTIYEHNQQVKASYDQTSLNSMEDEDHDKKVGIVNNRKHMIVKLILSVDRGRKAIEAKDIMELAQSLAYYPKDNDSVEREKVIVGIDFSGNPLGGRFQDFESTFNNARKLGFNLTVHAAEVRELSMESVDKQDETSFILDFRPDRLGHMLYLHEKHFKKLSELNQAGVAPLIEICPSTSFYMMGLHSFADHPHIRRLQSLHYPFSLNTDDSGIFNTTITEEILHMKTAVKLSIHDIAHFEAMSLKYAFIPDESEKQLVDSAFWNDIEKLLRDYPHSGLENLYSFDEKDDADMSSLYTM